MRRLAEQATRVARATTPILILGETGVGKEHLARILHDSSNRSRGPFVAINCAAIPADLLEAEMFGIGKGVATGPRISAPPPAPRPRSGHVPLPTGGPGGRKIRENSNESLVPKLRLGTQGCKALLRVQGAADPTDQKGFWQFSHADPPRS